MLLPFTLFPFTPTWGQATSQSVSFDTDPWALTDPEATIESVDGRTALTLQNGVAFVEDVALTHGVIEVDVQASGRGFAGIAFRAANASTYEKVYVRMHKTGSPDAVQYTPVFNGITSWQLYGPPTHWGTATFDAATWTTLRVEVHGTRLRVFVGDANEPALTVAHLKHPVRAGRIGVWGLFGTHFSNFRYTPSSETDAPALTNDTPTPSPPPGLLTTWSVSDVVPADSVAAQALLDDHAARSWAPLAAEADGLVNVARVRGKRDASPASQERDRVAVRTTIHAEAPRRVKLIFGYSDDVLIGLNGQPVFEGTAGFRSRSPLFQGMVGWHDAVYLDLQPGANTLVFVLTDALGGWGLRARLGDLDGLRTES